MLTTSTTTDQRGEIPVLLRVDRKHAEDTPTASVGANHEHSRFDHWLLLESVVVENQWLTVKPGEIVLPSEIVVLFRIRTVFEHDARLSEGHAR